MPIWDKVPDGWSVDTRKAADAAKWCPPMYDTHSTMDGETGYYMLRHENRMEIITVVVPTRSNPLAINQQRQPASAQMQQIPIFYCIHCRSQFSVGSSNANNADGTV